MRAALFALAVCAGAAGAQERPEQYRFAARIAGADGESHYRLSLPASTYRGVTRHDLGDLRIFNAAGEPVPYAFVPVRAKAQAPALHAARLFPLYGEEEKGMDGLNVRIRHTKAGTSIDVSSTSPPAPRAARNLLGYVVDASALKTPLQALLVDWQSRAAFAGAARVEASEDLRHWRPVVAGAPVLFLEHGGERLERKRIELSGARATYLRLSFTGVPPDFALTQARLELRPDRAEPAREWLSIAGARDPGRRGEYEFDTGGHFPLDRLRFVLPEPNTVAQAQVLARSRPEEPWRLAAATTLYRLRRDAGEIVNPDVPVAANPSRYWLLRVDQRGGGLGAGEVRLEIGWIPHEVVFAARGEGPFTLAYGMKVARPGALPIASVLPGYRQGEDIAPKAASVGEIVPVAREPASALAEPLRFLREAADSGEAKKWLLWAALVLGVLALVWMAFALLRQVGKR